MMQSVLEPLLPALSPALAYFSITVPEMGEVT